MKKYTWGWVAADLVRFQAEEREDTLKLYLITRAPEQVQRGELVAMVVCAPTRDWGKRLAASEGAGLEGPDGWLHRAVVVEYLGEAMNDETPRIVLKTSRIA